MKYEVSYEANGQTGSRLIDAATDAKALEKFRDTWEEYGDKFAGSCWVTGRWGQN